MNNSKKVGPIDVKNPYHIWAFVTAIFGLVFGGPLGGVVGAIVGFLIVRISEKDISDHKKIAFGILISLAAIAGLILFTMAFLFLVGALIQ